MPVRGVEAGAITALSLAFDHRALRLLPVDTAARGAEIFNSRTVRGAIYASAKVTPILRPSLVAFSSSALRLIGLNIPKSAFSTHGELLALYFSGNKLFEGCEQLAHCYAGHQFGSFAGQLGDGAAISLGEVLYNQTRHEVQLKGAGPTAFSRQSDGRKVLRSSIREYLCSEYMHHLGIPTTRAAALVTSDSTVTRDPLYNGKTVDERCSVCTRVAPSFLRFGSFEICKEAEGEGDRAGPSAGMPHILSSLMDYTMSSLFPSIVDSVRKTYAGDKDLKEASVLAVFEDVVARTAKLVADWQCVGFCHGVLNTDNMSIIGLTIDYGPYAFLSYYNESFVSNLSDTSGRYAFGQQSVAAQWNLKRLADSFSIVYPALEDTMHAAVDTGFLRHYHQALVSRTASMLGLNATSSPSLGSLVDLWYDTLQATSANANKVLQLLLLNFPTTNRFFEVVGIEERVEMILSRFDGLATNIASSACVPPNVVHADAAKQIRSLAPHIPKHQIEPLRNLLSTNEAAARQAFQGALPAAIDQFLDQQKSQWGKYEAAVHRAQRYKDLTLSGKKTEDEVKWLAFLRAYAAEIVIAHDTPQHAIDAHAAMHKTVPKFVLYPWVLDDAIRRSEMRDDSLVRELADRITTPYDADDRDGVLWSMDAPDDANKYLCSCSS